MKKKFDIIIFIGRPGAGKSEVIDFLKKVPLSRRLKVYHIARIVEMDDFNFLLKRGEQDDLREKKGQKRLDTVRAMHSSYRVKSKETYARMTLDINEYFRRHFHREDFFNRNTLFIEFARGGRRAYQRTLELLDPGIKKRAVILYIRVSFLESLRKNKRRYDPREADSILYHKVPYKVMLAYRSDDWDELTAPDRNFILLKHDVVPYVVFQNEPEKTSSPQKIKRELLKNVDRLLSSYEKKQMTM